MPRKKQEKVKSIDMHSRYDDSSLEFIKHSDEQEVLQMLRESSGYSDLGYNQDSYSENFYN